MTKIILLDIDGVLVTPAGYRAALHATLNYFARLMGLSHFEFPEEKIAELEGKGITSEWDMVPLLLAALWDDILAGQGRGGALLRPHNIPADPSAAAVEIGKYVNESALHLFIPEIELVVGEFPTETALKQNLFLNVPLELRRNLFHQSRDAHHSHATRLFQHYSLGSKVFSETYNLPAEIETESMLLTHDHSNINDAIREKLRGEGNYLAAFTARPSAPPREIKDTLLSYPPEAELGLKLVGLSDIPVIGYGKLEYIATQRGLDAMTLLKPAPAQALAAIVAAWTDNELAGLHSACDWIQTNEVKGALADLPRKFDLIIVEDTLGGVRSVRAAGEILRQAGFEVNVHAFGLTSGSAAKAKTFKQTGVPYFENWAELIAGSSCN